MEQQSQSLHQDLTQQTQTVIVHHSQYMPKVKHMYIQQENIYGRFIPYLLLKDQIDYGLDSSGNTVLHHMCSHNSPFIPLYLSILQNDDPTLNKVNRNGHTALDIAALYCERRYVDLLKQKGAKDTGQVDYWAIRGANLDNWSGKINPSNKQLTHWAAYNDQPEVLEAYLKQNCTLNDVDNNSYTPMDLAILNRSYKSIKLLAQNGYRPQQKLLEQCDSQSIIKIFQRVNESSFKKLAKRTIKGFYIIFYLFLCAFLLDFDTSYFTLIFMCILAWLWLICAKTQPQRFTHTANQAHRISAFKSDLVFGKEINFFSNHVLYTFLLILLTLCGYSSAYLCTIDSYQQALIYWVVLVMTTSFLVNFLIQFTLITANLTYSQLSQPHKWPHLWPRIKYIVARSMLIREYQNPYNLGFSRNIKQYFKRG